MNTNKTNTESNGDESKPFGYTLLAVPKNAVLCTERMPTEGGYYKTNLGLCFLEYVPTGLGLKSGLRWQFGLTPEWWEE